MFSRRSAKPPPERTLTCLRILSGSLLSSNVCNVFSSGSFDAFTSRAIMNQYDWQKMLDLQPSGLFYLDFISQWQVTSDGPQQSKTWPTPPPGIKAKVRELDILANVQLSSVPPYSWRRGCEPTSVGMVIGYYDGLGDNGLIPGDASTQTGAVNQGIAS